MRLAKLGFGAGTRTNTGGGSDVGHTGSVSSPVVGADQGYVSTIAIAARVRACVLVLDPPGQTIATTATDTGGYVVEGVPAGRWNVEFVPDDGCMGNDTADAFQY